MALLPISAVDQTPISICARNKISPQLGLTDVTHLEDRTSGYPLTIERLINHYWDEI